jgi:hypothetical protein
VAMLGPGDFFGEGALTGRSIRIGTATATMRQPYSSSRRERCSGFSTTSRPSRMVLYTFDARNNQPRIGRVLIARGRDATDVPISNIFGAHTLAGFSVSADEVDKATCVP